MGIWLWDLRWEAFWDEGWEVSCCVMRLSYQKPHLGGEAYEGIEGKGLRRGKMGVFFRFLIRHFRMGMKVGLETG